MLASQVRVKDLAQGPHIDLPHTPSRAVTGGNMWIWLSDMSYPNRNRLPASLYHTMIHAGLADQLGGVLNS